MSVDPGIVRGVEVDSKALYTGQFPVANRLIVFAIRAFGSIIETISQAFTKDSTNFVVPRADDVDVLSVLLGSPLEETTARSLCLGTGPRTAKQSSLTTFQHRSPVLAGALRLLERSLTEQMKYSVVILS